MPRPLHLEVACAENRTIGRAGRLPWSIPEDTRLFHEHTAGQIVILGRVSFDDWAGAREDGRRAVVVTQHPVPASPGVHSAPTFAEALQIAEGLPGRIHVCGGERIYAEALALTDRPLRLNLTLVHAEVPGDRHFPEWRHLPWRELSRRESHDANYRYTFLVLER
jgi:dihydrofolate reductase